MKGPEHLPCEKRLRDLDLFSLEKRRMSRDLMQIYKYLKLWGAKRRDQTFFSSGWSQDKEKWLELKHRKIQTNVHKNLFTVRVTEHWNWLPRGVVESPSLKILKACLDALLCNLV